MTSIKSLLLELYDETQAPSSHERRELLITEMDKLERGMIHCFSCPGTCCTFSANSMQITPIEALEILVGLNYDDMSFEEKESLKSQMEKTIKNYRLDVEVYTGKKNSQSLRKNYTCPFFNNGALGCSLSRSIKPYGCLGFNPKTSEDNGKSCASNIDLLNAREERFQLQEEKLNSQLREHHALPWNKKSIPEALLEILRVLGK